MAVTNINVGVLGHVDCGKTSLVRALSTKLSTAALDKHPQSKQRGITIDLGFSSFVVARDGEVEEPSAADGEFLRFTLVDCPGHASLIRTVIGGAQIIDRIVLVVDVTKGIQTQTAECLVIGEILCGDLVVVLNKIDLLDLTSRQQRLDHVCETIRKVLSKTRFKNAPMIPVSARVGGDGKAGVGQSVSSMSVSNGDTSLSTIGIDGLVQHLRDTTIVPDRRQNAGESFFYAIDHCFSIRGQGTVLTGTVLSGSVAVGQTVELPALKLERKVKSMQIFGDPVTHASAGDRVALCLPNLDSKLVERGVVSAPRSLSSSIAIFALVRKVRYHSQSCESSAKVHISVGHSTVLGKCTFFGSTQLKKLAKKYQGKDLPEEVDLEEGIDYQFDSELKTGGQAAGGPVLQMAMIELERPVFCQERSLIVASRLDMDLKTEKCRIAFFGRTIGLFSTESEMQHALEKFRVYKIKERTGKIERVVNNNVASSNGLTQEVIIRGMIEKGADSKRFIGKEIVTASGEKGTIVSSFGSSGKLKVSFPDGASLNKGDTVFLRFKHLLFVDKSMNKTVCQS